MSPNAAELYTTLAASAAALVAIVGGFLIARLVSISQERDGLLRRRRDHQRDFDEAETELAAAVADRLQRDERAFREEMMRTAVAGAQDPVDLAARSRSTDSSIDDVEQFAVRLLESVARARADMEAIPLGVTIDPEDLPLAIGAGDGDAYTAVAEAEVKRRARPSMSSLSALLATHDGWSSMALAGSGVGLRPVMPYSGPTREERWGNRVRDLREKVRVEDEEIARLGRPHGVTLGMCVLGGVALVAVVPPVILLAVDPVPAGPWARYLAVSGFVLGLVALMGYLIWQVKALQRDPE
jgi:hypothetical protein